MHVLKISELLFFKMMDLTLEKK